MYPTIHDYTATDLTTQGFGSLSDCISCEVTEELNGAFTLEMKYPLNGLHSEYLTTGSIIMAKPSHNQGKQPFRISEIKKSFANNIDVYANHICYDLSGYPVRASASYNSLASVINAMNAMTWSTGTSAYNQFSFSTDKTSSAAFKMEGLQTLRSWMGGQEGSIIDTYGGEWVYDGFDCYLASRRGEDTGYRISYGKNLEEYEKQKTYADYSHIVAFWKKSEVVVYSDLVATGVSCAFRCAYYDASNDYDTQPTTAQLNTLAASKASGLGVDVQTITITPAQIGNDVIGLGDSVLVCYETVLKTRVVKTVWDVLVGEYTTIQLGTKQVNIADTIKSLSTAPSGESGSGGSSGMLLSANWTANSSSALWTNLTQSVSLSKGKWVASIHIPIISTSTVGVRLDATSGTTTLNNNWYSLVPSQMTIPRLFEVTSATATVVLHCAQSASVTFSNTERGGVVYVRVSD